MFQPRTSRTESVVDSASGYMEFDLQNPLGYQEWRGMFLELGVKACLFNGYMVQSHEENVRVSQTPIQFHLYEHAMYLAPPFETREYYIEIPRTQAFLARSYFTTPATRQLGSLDGYKPKRQDMQALDVWVWPGDGVQTIYTLIYEARIRTNRTEYYISRFEAEQLHR